MRQESTTDYGMHPASLGRAPRRARVARGAFLRIRATD
jgi:hypothetical protein